MSWIKTFSLLIVLTALVVVAGGAIGGQGGLVTALIFAFVMNFVAYWFSDKLALMMAGAKKVTEEENPKLYSLVRDVAQKAALPMPKVYVMDEDTPNAFATGRNPQHSVVAVTTGIQRLLTDQELEGVLAHEMAHVRNRDMLIMTLVAVMAGAISFLATMLQWSLIFGGMGGRRDDREGGAGGMIGMLVMIIVMPIAAALVRFAISRTREYAADETGARILGNPLPLASALDKLEAAVHRKPLKATATNEAMAHLYIVNPLAANGGAGKGFVNLFSTHPPIEERVRRLRQMAMTN